MGLRTAFALGVSQEPKQGPKGLPITIVFADAETLYFDMTLEQQQGAIDYAQSVYVDNSGNNNAMHITFDPMGYDIVLKALQQGTFPVLCGAGPLRFKAISAGAGTTKIILTNVEIPPAVWAI